MAGHGSKLPHKQEAAIVALLSHRSIEDAARAVEIGPATLHRWLKDPLFKEAYRQARRDAFSQCHARLQSATSAAASTLMKMMVDAAAPPAAKIRAAIAILDHASRAFEIEDLESRISELEKHNQNND
jgi:hypothetical protein